VSRRLWWIYLAVGAAITALYVFVPPLKGSGPVMNLLGLSPVLAILVGIRVHKPRASAPWWIFAAAQALFWAGDLYTYSYPKVFGADVPFPSPGDALYLLVYPLQMAGLLLLVRRRNPEGDRSGLIDSLIITVGLSLFSWIGLIAPNIHADGLTVVQKLVSTAYPLGDILLLAAAIRLAVDRGRRERSFFLLAASIVALLATDFLYGRITLANDYHGQLWLDVGWISFYLLWGAAALHPSMRDLDRAAPERDARLSPARLFMLTAASLIAPVIELARGSTDADLIVIIAASIVLFGLVVMRMAELVRQQERSVARERALTAAGAALVAAGTRDEIGAATVEAAYAMAAGAAPVCLCILEDGAVQVVASSGEQAPWTLPADTAAELRAAAAREVVTVTPALRAGLRLPDTAVRGLALPLELRGETRGLLMLGTNVPRAVRGSLRTLLSHASLALEGVILAEEVLERTSEARLSSLVKHSSDLITVLDANAIVTYQSPSIEGVLGYSPADVLGGSFARLLADGEPGRLLALLADGPATAGASQVLECPLRHRDGSRRHFEVLVTNLLDDEHVRGIVLNARDVSERKAFEEQLAHQAFHDPVTGLANRALFGERVRHAVARARREDGGIAVLFADLDDFKTINDSLGHAVGDEVLVEVAKRLATSVRASDTAARFGGDEFAILLEDVESAQEAADTAERILAAVGEPLTVSGKQLSLRASLGIAMVESSGAADADELLRNADAAMYIAKRDGKGGYRLFEPAMHEGVLARLELRADLQRALDEDQFELHYQPVVRLDDGQICSLEALLRWRHPERGLVPPDDFIPFAEEAGLIVPIGRWVLREGCRQARALKDVRGPEGPLSIAINLSVKQLQDPDVIAHVREALEESGLDPALLTLEITETVMVADTEVAIRRLHELKALGVRLAMDDFGTGYSSLSYLNAFPVDVLKMDRSFLRDGATPEQSGLASAVIAIGETLRLDVVAEGIELPAQADALRDLGCDLGQGFYFARPMTADAVVEHLREHVAAPVDAA
jgi:diguanylate cyclase (GGDEF)-like protein/PAS domain S-box-containing protein